MPEQVIALHRFFLPLGVYSDTSAPVVATSAPTPSPLKKRIHPNTAMVVEIAVMPTPIENQA
jgi:hypothetical protein